MPTQRKHIRQQFCSRPIFLLARAPCRQARFPGAPRFLTKLPFPILFRPPAGASAGSRGAPNQAQPYPPQIQARQWAENASARPSSKPIKARFAANEKIVSLFEPHADIIVKGGRETQYGHKLNLTTGRSGMILDLVIEAGNPADSERFLPMLKRHIAVYGEAPRQGAADGGYASRHNLGEAKALGVRDMASTRRPACASRTWSKATGSIASCATSEPASNRTSPV